MERETKAITIQSRYSGFYQRAITSKRNTEEHRNPRNRSMVEEWKAYRCGWKSGEAPRFSGTLRVMQRPELRQRRRSTVAAKIQRLSSARKTSTRRGMRGKSGNDPSALFIKARDKR